MTLAKRIRDCRYAKGWGPDELAQRADISRTALYQIECGKTETPRAGTLRRIARALEVPIERLLGRAGDQSQPGARRERIELFDRRDALLWTWLLAPMAFQFGQRFTAVRYLIATLPAAILFFHAGPRWRAA